MPFKLTSPAFTSGDSIPRRFTGDAEDFSPPLEWSWAPTGTGELVLVVDDPDASEPEGRAATPWVHWVLLQIPATISSLPQGLPPLEKLMVPPGALNGKNSWGRLGYAGPLPPIGDGDHHYRFCLYALEAPLGLPPGTTLDALRAAMHGHVLGTAELIGIYRRDYSARSA